MVNKIIIIMFGVLLITSINVFSQRSILGNWRIENLIFIVTSDYKEKEMVRDECINCKIEMKDSLLIFRGNKKCDLLESKSNFFTYQLDTLTFAEASQTFSDKAIYYIFGDRRRSYVETFETNYQMDNEESKMRIIIIDWNNLILYFETTLIFLKRLK